MSNKNGFCQIFESELRKKLSERSKSIMDEIRLLLNSFKFYDLDYIGIIDKINWVKGILKTGLTGISENDLLSIFPCYDTNNSGFIDYKNFTNYLYGREQLNPLPKKPDINVFEPTYKITNKKNNYISNTTTTGMYPYSINPNYNNYNNYNYLNKRNRNININNINNEYLNSNNKYNNGNIDTNKSDLNMNKYSNKKVFSSSISKEDEMKNFFETLLLKFKNRINTNNGLTFYIFAKKLKSYEINNKIDLNDFIQIFREMRLDFTENDVKNFFYMLDINEMNFININDVINKIKGEMSEERKLYVLNKFDIIDKQKKGEININYLKIIYKNNAKYHPDVIKGIKSEDIIYNQFKQTLELFLDINKILNEIITKEEFVDYYSAISASIQDDIYFQDILNGIYDLSKLYNINANNNNNSNINERNNINNNNNYRQNNNFENYKNYIRQNNYNYNNERNNRKFMSKSLSSPEIIPQRLSSTPYINNIRNNNLIDNNRYNLNYNGEESKNDNNNNTIANSISDPYYRPKITPGEKGIKRFKKIIYNPITKELLYSNNFNNKYNNEQNENSLNENNNKSPMKRYKNNIYLFDEDKYNQQKLIELFNQFRNEIISKGEKYIFILQKLLYEFNTDYHPNYISFDNFCVIFQKLEINNINIDGIKKIFEIFDKNNIGYINYDNFFKNVVGYMGRTRQNMVRKVYEALRKDQNGNIFVVDFKKLFNGDRYNEIFGGQKTKEYIYYDFIDNLEIFLNYRNKLYNKYLSNILNYDDFLRFFDQISMYINNDDMFEKYINYCWNVNSLKYNNRDAINYCNNRKHNNAIMRTGSQIMNW